MCQSRTQFQQRCDSQQKLNHAKTKINPSLFSPTQLSPSINHSFYQDYRLKLLQLILVQMAEDSPDRRLCLDYSRHRRNQQQTIFLIVQNQNIRTIRFRKNTDSHLQTMNEITFSHPARTHCHTQATVAIDMNETEDLQEIIDRLLAKFKKQKEDKAALDQRIRELNEELNELQRDELMFDADQQQLAQCIIKNNRLQIRRYKRQHWKLLVLLMTVDIIMAVHNIVTLILQVYYINQNASSIHSYLPIYAFIFFALCVPFLSSCGLWIYQQFGLKILPYLIHYIFSYGLLAVNTVQLFTGKAFKETWEFLPDCRPFWKFSYSLFSIKTIIFLSILWSFIDESQNGMNSILFFMSVVEMWFWVLTDLRFYINQTKIAEITRQIKRSDQEQIYQHIQQQIMNNRINIPHTNETRAELLLQ